MDRRRFLVLSGSTLPLAGCTSFGASRDEPDRSDDIHIGLSNGTAEPVTVGVTVSFLDTDYFETEQRVEAEAMEHVYPGIHWPGEYTITIAVEGREERTFQFDVEEFDLRAGSNFIVWIGSNDVRYGVEE